jgi:hypothetical protein
MGLSRQHWLAMAGAGGVAVAMPLLLLGTASAPRMEDAAPMRALPLQPRPVPTLTALYKRPLFASAGLPEERLPEDAPDLLGIAGRLNRDAVAMVRGADGSARSLAIGDSVDGWRLGALAIDAAFFERSGQRIRVPLASGE